MLKKLLFLLIVTSSSLSREYLDLNCPIRPMDIDYIKPAVYLSKPCIGSCKSFNSSNWAGMMIFKNLENPLRDQVRTIWGTWDVPKLKPMPIDAYCSIWVGIDGWLNNFIEQIGTSHNWIDGKQHNFAWFSVYPNPPYEIVDFPISEGDSISASVVYTRNGVYELQIFNNTKFVFTTCPYECTQSYGLRSSGQWVVESFIVQGQPKPLANFGTINFKECEATLGGYYGSITDEAWAYRKMDLAEQSFHLKGTTSKVSDDGKSFSVEWKHS